MSMDPIADMLAVIMNANHKYFEKCEVPASQIKQNILDVFKKEGYINGYKTVEESGRKKIRIYLKYLPDKTKAIQKLKRISRSGLRKYRSKEEIPKVHGGLGVMVVSTSKGIMTDKEARKNGIGGEIICSIW